MIVLGHSSPISVAGVTLDRFSNRFGTIGNPRYSLHHHDNVGGTIGMPNPPFTAKTDDPKRVDGSPRGALGRTIQFPGTLIVFKILFIDMKKRK